MAVLLSQQIEMNDIFIVLKFRKLARMPYN